MNNTVHLGDCMIGMKQYPDKYFCLAVCDPPYGFGVNMNMGRRKGKAKKHIDKGWDSCSPSDEYFEELFRVSKQQIIWGGNYFGLPPNKCFIIWDKGETMYNRDFAEAEYAWCSHDESSRIFKHSPNQLDRIHPTQKMVALYDWIFANYLPNGGKVIDTHIGSGSSRISAYKRGNIDFTGYELDADYWQAQEDRFREFVMKVAPADLEPITKQGQIKLF
jgi:site-specific DNA-methyltransferase (adenine-specific)